ncbi:hypothetical protein DSM25558_4222 [Agrobacterium sp. DSM 25558]|nr:hypothetical protein DSM25558_4222 [Agrobacterium sp. DSM 25558]
MMPIAMSYWRRADNRMWPEPVIDGRMLWSSFWASHGPRAATTQEIFHGSQQFALRTTGVHQQFYSAPPHSIMAKLH